MKQRQRVEHPVTCGVFSHPVCLLVTRIESYPIVLGVRCGLGAAVNLNVLQSHAENAAGGE